MGDAKRDVKSILAEQPYDRNLPNYKKKIYPKDKIGPHKSIGPYFYYILDWQTGTYPFISDGWRELVDYPPSFWKKGIEAVLNKVHEDDIDALRNMIRKSHEFISSKSEKELNKHSICFDYRVYKNNGEVINILQQSIYMSLDKKGNIIYDLGMVTDISHLKNNGDLSLRIIGPDRKTVLEYYPKQSENANDVLNEKLYHWQMLKTHNDFINQVHKVIVDNLHNPDFTVSSLSHFMNISRSQLHRKIKVLADISPNYLLKVTRLHHALKLIRENNRTLSEVAYAVGFSSPTYFSKCFSEEFGCSPTEFKLTLN